MATKFPLTPDDPIIKVLDGLITGYVDRARAAQEGLARKYSEVAEAGWYRARATSYDATRGSDWHPPRRQMEDIVKAAQDWLRADQQIGDLQRMRLALFGDVDFGGGQSILHLLTQSRPFADPPTTGE